MKKRILASLLALCIMGGMLPTASLAAEPGITTLTTEQKLNKDDGEPANRAPSAPAFAGAEEDSLEPVLVSAGEGETPTSGTCGENLTWELDLETGTLTISGRGEMTDYPNKSTPSPWDSLDSVKTIVIGDGVTHIGSRAFYQCQNLSSITIPDSVVTIGYLAFYGCSSLLRIDLPDSISEIGNSAFNDCSSLIEVKLPEEIKTIEYSMFYGCNNLSNIDIPDGVTTIEFQAFQNCSRLTEITIPNGVTKIERSTFQGCTNLVSITIPESVTNIEHNAFEDCTSLAEIMLPSGITELGQEAFKNCSSLAKIVIPEGITNISYGLLSGCTNLKEILIPDTVTTIGAEAFEDCSNLAQINIPDAVTEYPRGIFSGCSGLTSITIPSQITKIGAWAFQSCSGLTEVNIPNTVTDIDTDDLFSGCSNLMSVTLPDCVDSIGVRMFENCYELKDIEIPKNITAIGENAFYGCKNLTNINIPDGVSSIGRWAFDGCSSLDSVDIPDSVTYIDHEAFSNCSSLTSIEIPGSVTSFYAAFSDCSNLTDVIISDGVAKIDTYAFSYCTNLTNIYIPSSVVSIEGWAFEGCNNLKNVYYSGSEAEWASISKGTNITDALYNNATIHYNSTAPDSGAPDSRTTSVKYLTSWDETSRTAVFSDDSHIRYTAVTDADLPSDGVAQLVNRYVLVECAQDESDVNQGQLFRLQTVNSALGSLTAGTETTVTIDGVEYPWDSQTGPIVAGDPLQVLYHTIDGALAGYTVLSEKMGTAGDWNGTDTVHLDGVDFHTNYMTDQDSLAEISKIADKDQAVVYYFVGDALLKAKLGNNDPVDPPIELYYTKIGTLTACDLDQMTLAIDGKSFSVQDDQYIKDTLKDNLNDAVGKQTVFVITSGKVSYAMPLERVSTRLEAVATVEPSTITYQGGYDRTSIAAKVEVRNVYDVDPWVDTNMLEAAIAQNVPDWNGNITLNHADFEIAWKSSEQSSESIEKFMVFSDGAYEDHFLTNDCKTTVENITVLSLGESATISTNIAVNPDYAYNNSEYAADFPKGETEKVVQISAEVEGQSTSGETLQDSSVCSITAQYPDNIMTEEEIEAIAAEASEELEKIDGAISLDLNTMYNVFGLKGDAIDQLEKDLLSVIVMSNIPEETLEEKISSDIVDKVIGKYVPKEVTASTYTVPLVYEIATPQSKYGQMTVQFNCDVHTYNLHGTNFALWVTVNYEILRSDKPVRADQVSGFLGQGTRTDVGAFASAAYSLAEAELKKQYNSVWGNSANRVADFLFDDTIKMIFEEMDTTFKDEVWKLIVWPTTNAKIECPVNVFVYDHQDKLVGSIENDVVTKSSDEFELSVDGDTKYITGLEDLYTIKYVATDNGTMDITFTEFSGYETPARQIAFYDVPLVKQQSYTQNLPEAIQSETEEYKLISSDNTSVPADMDQSLLNLSPVITPTPETCTITFNGNGGTASQATMETGADGTLDTLPTASRDKNYRFDGWFTVPTGGTQITTDTVFDQDTTVYAHWSYVGRPADDDGHSSSGGSSSDPSYRIDVDMNVQGGDVTLRPTSASVGTRVTITANPDNGYEVDQVIVTDRNGKALTVTQRGENTYTFQMPDSRVSVEVTFTRLQQEEPVPAGVPFTDVAEDAWYYGAVSYVAQRGLMTGVSSNVFTPDATLTRAQLVQILYALEGRPAVSSASAFTDVASGAWYANAVSWAAASGVASGVGSGAFGPNDPLTREQLALILYRYAQNQGYDTTQGGMAVREFADYASISNWALEAVQWAVNAGLISGIGNGMLSPNGTATRAQVAVILMQFCQQVMGI